MGRRRIFSADKELEVLQLIAMRKRLTNRALADRFGCSEGTIRNLATGKDYKLRVAAHVVGLSDQLPTRLSADQLDRLSFSAS